jgi:hypothetical protein
MEDDHMIKALPPNGTNHALDVGSLLGERGVDSTSCIPMSRTCPLNAEDRIAVAQEITWELVKRKGFPQLLSCPPCGRVRGHIEVKNTATVMGQYQKHVEDMKSNSWYREEIDRDQLLGMILQEWRFLRAHDVFADAAFADVDAKFEQFTVDAGCTLIPDSPGTSCGLDLGPPPTWGTVLRKNCIRNACRRRNVVTSFLKHFEARVFSSGIFLTDS